MARLYCHSVTGVSLVTLRYLVNCATLIEVVELLNQTDPRLIYYKNHVSFICSTLED